MESSSLRNSYRSLPGSIILITKHFRGGVMVFNATSAIFQLHRFNDGGKRSIRRKPPICRKSLTNFIIT